MSERAPSPAGDDLLVEQHDGVLTLTINRADASNAIPYTVRDALIAEFERAHADLAVRVVVLTGAGERHFCTGADLRVRPPAPTRPEGAPDFVTGQAVEMMRTGFQRLMVAIQDCQKPVIAALNGTAAGGGAMLALAADLVVAADTARFVDVFASRGLVPDGGFAYLLPHIVGMHRAAEIVMLGDTISADEARETLNAHLGRLVFCSDPVGQFSEWQNTEWSQIGSNMAERQKHSLSAICGRPAQSGTLYQVVFRGGNHNSGLQLRVNLNTTAVEGIPPQSFDQRTLNQM